MSTTRFNTSFVVWAGGIVLLIPTIAQAGGYALNEKSASAMGLANAGAAANAENASVLLFNPAGMGYLEGTQLSGGLAVVDVNADFSGSATTNVGITVEGSDGGDLVDPSVIPNFAISHRLSDQYSVGLGVSVPFGVTADYDDDFKGRYFADETEVEMIDVQPTVAFNNNEGFAVGLGLNVLYAEGKVTKFQDFSSPEGMPPEGHFEAEGDDWAVGVVAGMLFQPFQRTTLGLTYRSSIDVELEGHANLSSFPARPGGVTLHESVTVPLDTPESLAFSLKQDLTGGWTLFAGATWTRWSRFEDLDILSNEENGAISAVSANGPEVVAHVTENWENTWSFAVGTKWQATDNWAFKAGYAYDESPIQEHYRTVRIPGADRNWLTLGAQWKSQDDLSIDLAAGYLIIDDADVNEVEYDIADQPVASLANVTGTYELDAWGAAVQVSKAF